MQQLFLPLISMIQFALAFIKSGAYGISQAVLVIFVKFFYHDTVYQQIGIVFGGFSMAFALPSNIFDASEFILFH